MLRVRMRVWMWMRMRIVAAGAMAAELLWLRCLMRLMSMMPMLVFLLLGRSGGVW